MARGGVLVLVAAALVSVVQVTRAQLGSGDPTALLRNQAFVRRQLACVSGTGPCDFIGQYIRGVVGEVLGRNCASCTPQQAANARTVLEFLRTNYPNEYTQIYNMYRSPAG